MARIAQWTNLMAASFEPAIDTAGPAPTQTQTLQGLGTQFVDKNAILDHFVTKEGVKLTNENHDFIAMWLRNTQEQSADREDALFIPIDQRLRIMTYANIYEELHRAGLRGKEQEQITSALCRRKKDSMQRIFAILCMLAWPQQITAFMDAQLLDSHLPFTFKGNLVYRKPAQGQQQLGAPIRLFQTPEWRPHLRDGFALYQRQVCAPFFRLSWTADHPISHYLLKDSLVLPFMRVERPADEIQNNRAAALFLVQGGNSVVHKVKIHSSHHNPNPDPVSRKFVVEVHSILTMLRMPIPKHTLQSNN
jgi:hypothetical protein